MVLAIIQARMGSTRLPGKVLRKVNGIPLIEILFKRIEKSRLIDKAILATSIRKENDVLSSYVEKIGIDVYRGSENDVLKRYYDAAKKYKPETIVRITGDCPIIDPELVDEVINLFQNNKVDYASNINPPTFPDGLDAEVFSFSALKKAHIQSKLISDREHVTPFIRREKHFDKINLSNNEDFSSERWTVDTEKDFKVIKNIVSHFQPNLFFNWKEVIELKKQSPNLFLANQNINRNEGMKMGTGQKLYKRAKELIPGGTMLLSKRPEMFLPNTWPSYFSKAKDCRVWDLDGNQYYDMSIMGIGTNTLGYGNEEVDNAVMSVIEKGNMSTLNCPEEVYLAEKLINLHPWADMVRFARSGGEANAIAIRIARAAVGKDKVAICGYHGWHDWYISANLSSKSKLDGHLLPGLEPKGVPRNLIGSTIPFNYNDIESLEKVISEHDIGIIKMEVSRSFGPEKDYLENVRSIASKNNIILIFDECTSGFRETFGGLHLKYNVEPDLMMLGKTLGNGYAITSVVGKKEVMKSAEETFISSTFWTERIGSTAALKTIEIMEKKRSWEIITEKGSLITKRWKALAKKHELPIQISGLPALTTFNFSLNDWQKYKTYITQEMLKKSFLVANSVYVCTEHKNEIIDEYFENLDSIFAIISDCENGMNIDDLLDGPVSHSGFTRLN